MTQPQIIYVRSSYVNDPGLQPVLDQYPDYNWPAFKTVASDLYQIMSGLLIRTGQNVFPFKNDIVDILGCQVPVYDPAFKLSFADVCDQRYHELRQQYGDRPWLVCWSGGVDSTVILASILRNASSAEQATIKVACNRASVYENPRFFFDQVKPNFEIIDSTNMIITDLAQEYYILDGNFGDQLAAGGHAQAMLFNNPADLDRNFRQDPDYLIDYLAGKCQGNRATAEWYYQQVLANIDSVDIPLETYYDFFFWTFFNMVWMAVFLRSDVHGSHTQQSSLKDFYKSMIPWFGSAGFQQWAMANNRRGIKYGSTMGQSKLEYKQYIHSVDHDEYYLNFKTKIDSLTRKSQAEPRRFALLDDFTWLNLDRDLEQILQLLPAHIQV